MIFFKNKNKEKKLIEERKIERIRVFVSGTVQGVFFRESTKKMADKFNILGWVKNLKDGRVEAVFEGEKTNIKKMISWVGRGPILAKVENFIVIEEGSEKEFSTFEIRHEL